MHGAVVLVDIKMIAKLPPSVFLIIIATLFVPVKAQINLALYGTAAQQTTYTDGAGVPYTANLAVEGPANNNWEDGCSSTGYQAKTWWGFFLPRLAYITNVKSYYRKDEAIRMNDFRLYFANDSVYQPTELCFRDTRRQAHSNLNQSIDCHLSPTRNIYYFNRNTFVELCYIEINGCWKGFWGENCTVPCPPTCIEQHCYPANGSCVWGCNSTNCMNTICYTNTGACFEGCVLGRAGQYCNKYNLAYNQTANILPVSQSNAGLSVDGLISTCIMFSSNASSSYLEVEFESLSAITTVHIVFGRDKPTAKDGHAVYCSNTTGKWSGGILLYSGLRLDTDITTFAVCKYFTYVPPTLSGKDMVELCEIEIGGCPYRRYGDNCEHVCPENCLGQGQCDLISGNCLSGCSDGWVGEQCDQGCWKGTWGTNCIDTCSSKCINQDCYPGDGFCVWGCDPQNCHNNNCNNQTIVCIEGCVDGLVGQYCNTTSLLKQSDWVS